GSTTAVQLTAGPGYDYQPDWSPDGSRIAFVRYHNDALELHLIDVGTGSITQLTDEGAANIEPRWSPDGRKLAFVSTRDNGRFHLYVGDVVEDTLRAEPLFEERVSEIPRYYYSAYDHELSPAWSPDGSEIAYVSNPEIPYGSGAIWRRNADGSGEARLVRMEETSWRARPDWSPDGGRIAYASYLGRQWHQLWVTRPEGRAEPFPLSYGDFDISSPRWSPDGQSIAYISNESGSTGIVIQALVGGERTEVKTGEKHYLSPMATLALSVVDHAGKAVAARVAVTGSDGRNYAPDDAWMHADDGFDRRYSDYEAQYFHLDRPASVTLPGGATTITVWRGPEHEIETVTLDTPTGKETALAVKLERLSLPDTWRDWISGDVHVHMNYGGTYRNTPVTLARQARAEDLDVVWNLIVNKEQRIPDIAYFSPMPDPASDAGTLIVHAQEYHTSYWGHMWVIGLESHLLVPDYSAYPETAAASIYPDNATVSRLAHKQGAAVGYVHPFEPPPPDPAGNGPLTNAFPVDVALGLVDYYEVVGFADPRTSADVWYGLLNCGLRVAAAGGTDAMANYASLRGPVGLNRTYVHVPNYGTDPAARKAAWLDGLRAGRTMATNGPIVGLTVDGLLPGSVIDGPGPRDRSYRGFLRSAVPIDHLELVLNGEVIRTVETGDDGKTADFEGTVTVDQSGWLLLRAWNEESHPQVFDLYPYATTSPVYVTVGGKAARSPDDAAYYGAWVNRIRESVLTHPDFNDAAERDSILANLAAAEARFDACR
ncbi:MAG: CehA/McbA family metallohydrolase, partial [Gammaproteobacteria bacterium]|nr:CehA/McbA family metallohydrolase [Gammaproteobacteria bacterium]